MNKYRCAAVSDIGVDREKQEDFVQFRELDDENLLCIVADGTGSRNEFAQPAAIASLEIIQHIEEIFHNKPELFFSDPCFFLKEAMLSANRILGAMKMANEPIFSGYAASVTCCLFSLERKIFMAHAGNTRLYILRNGAMYRLSRDHTKAMQLLEEGKIDIGTYHVHPDRLKMTSGIGVVADPEIQVMNGALKEYDIAVMTTDGIHYAIQEPFMADFIIQGANCEVGAANLIAAAKDGVHYPDNMSAMLIYRPPEGGL